jgi:hypothetical protein
MNSFAAHGITHLSPSSCNQWAASPATFVLTRLLKRSSSVGAAAHRGTAVEDGIATGLRDPAASLADCVKVALDRFETLTALSGDPKLEKERDAIPGFVEFGLRELKPYGVPTGMQGRVELKFEGLEVPVMGYYDFRFGDIIVDLKTSHSLASKISTSHARQVALYAAAERAEGRVAYVTSKKTAVYKLENSEQHLKSLANIALSIQKFLSISTDPKELAQFVSPDIDSFYFSDPLVRQAAFEVWGV